MVTFLVVKLPQLSEIIISILSLHLSEFRCIYQLERFFNLFQPDVPFLYPVKTFGFLKDNEGRVTAILKLAVTLK